MARALKIGIYQGDSADDSLQQFLLNIEGLKIVGRWDDSCDLPAEVSQARPDLVAALLNGSSPARGIERVAGLTKVQPSLAVFGVGLPNEPELLKSAMRARMSELLDLPLNEDCLLNSLQSVAGRLGSKPSGRLIAVRSCGGGCGSTTVAVNLAVELAKRGPQKVALVDLDLKFGHAATLLDLSPNYSIADLAHQSEAYDDHVIRNAMAKHESGLSVLVRPRDPGQSNVSLIRLSAILGAMLECFDIVVVDENSRSDMSARIVQDLADELVLVTQPVVHSVRSASQMIAGLDGSFNMDHLRIVANRMPRKAGSIDAAKMQEHLRRPVFAEIPEDWEAVSRSINLGIPLANCAADSRVREAIRALAKSLGGEPACEHGGTNGHGGNGHAGNGHNGTNGKGSRSMLSWLRGRAKKG